MIRHMRNYPKELQIGENLWEIRFVKAIPGEGPNTVGLCDPGDHTIYIKMGQTSKNRFMTFTHEVCHAICYEHKIEENHSTIYALEEPILRLLVDNGITF